MASTPLTDEQIDSLVATEVMEWEHKPGVEGRWYEYGNLVATEDWSPTTDMQDAWQVVRQLEGWDYYLRLTKTKTGNWRCDLELLDDDDWIVSVVCDTAPLAICSAAIKLVRYED